MRIYSINPFVGLLTGCQQAYTGRQFESLRHQRNINSSKVLHGNSEPLSRNKHTKLT